MDPSEETENGMRKKRTIAETTKAEIRNTLKDRICIGNYLQSWIEDDTAKCRNNFQSMVYIHSTNQG